MVRSVEADLSAYLGNFVDARGDDGNECVGVLEKRGIGRIVTALVSVPDYWFGDI
jgi:hypothetical protein